MESPSEYLERLKKQHPPRSPDPENAKAVLASIGESADVVKDLLIADRDYAQLLLQRLRPSLEQSLVRFLDELIANEWLAIGEVYDASPNAYTHELSPLRFAIVFNSGLREFLYRVARVLSTRYRFQNSTDDAETLSFEHGCHFLADIFVWFKETGQVYGPSYRVTKEQMLVASQLATEAETFFLAHELGHVIEQFYMHFGSLDSKEPNSIVDTPIGHDEFTADRFALRILLSDAGDADSSRRQDLAYAGAELGLQIHACLEQLGVSFHGSHPPARERIEFLRSSLDGETSSINSLVSLAKCNDALFQRVAEFIISDDFDVTVEEEASSLIQELDSLLTQHTGGMVPDYAGFISPASRLLRRGYSHKVMNRFANVATDFLAVLRRTSASSDGDNRQAWIAFQKYKLLLHSVEFLPEPAKQVFDRALRLDE